MTRSAATLANGRTPTLAVLLLAACTPGAGDSDPHSAIGDLLVENPHATTMNISWTTAVPTMGVLRYGARGEDELVVSSGAEPATEHALVLRFLRARTPYDFTVEAWEGDDLLDFEGGSFDTPPVPGELPALHVEVDELEEPKLILASIMSGGMAPVIVSQDGHYVWWHLEQSEGTTIAQARLAPDGSAIYYDSYDRGESSSPDAAYWIRRVSIDDGEVESHAVHRHHHDFLVHDDGTIAWIKADSRLHEGTELQGDAIVETRDGDDVVIWSSWDSLELDLSEDCYELEDGIWTHANALDYDPETATYFLSIRQLDTVVAIERDHHRTKWELGGCRSDLAFTEDSTPFDGQHRAQFLDDSVLVYDNRPSDEHSRVVEYALDHDARLATEIWSYDAGGAYSTEYLGDTQRLDSGNTLVIWSSAATIEEVDPDGELLWKGSFDFGTVVGYSAVITP